MNKQYRLLFVHGWGFSQSFWEPLAVQLKEFSIQIIDLGFIGESKTSLEEISKIIENQQNYIAIGHSLGFFYLLKSFPLNFHHYIAINSFARFSKGDGFGNGVAQRILDRMSKGLEQTPKDTLSQFYQQCGCFDIQPSTSHIAELKEGLEWLKYDDFRAVIHNIRSKLTVIVSTKDPVVSSAMTLASFENCHCHWIDDNTHILPRTHPSDCAKIIRNSALCDV